MDAGTYEEILGQHGSMGSISHWPEELVTPQTLQTHMSIPKGTHQRRGGQYTASELKLREDFARNKFRWVGEYWKDLWYFSINTNPFLALCYSHPLHQVGRKERYVITLFQALFVMIVACGLSEAQDCLACGITSCSIRNNTCLTTWEQEAIPDGDAKHHEFGQAKRAVERRHAERGGDGGDMKDPSLNMCCACKSSPHRPG